MPSTTLTSVRTRGALVAAGVTVTALLGLLPAAAAQPAAPTSAPPTTATQLFGTPKAPANSAIGDPAFLRPGGQIVAGRPGVLNGTGLGLGAGNASYTQTGFTLVLQPDGNLVEYQRDARLTARAVWSTGTTTGTRLVFQGDGNVVLYDGAGRALWSTGTAGTAAATFVAYGNGQLVVQDRTGQVLKAVGPAVVGLPSVVTLSATSPSGGRYVLTTQADGNVVAYDTTTQPFRAFWSSGTSGTGPGRLVAQPDGNLVLYQLSTGRAVWQSGSHGAQAYYQLDMQAHRNIVLYLTDGKRRLQAVWQSGTTT